MPKSGNAARPYNKAERKLAEALRELRAQSRTENRSTQDVGSGGPMRPSGPRDINGPVSAGTMSQAQRERGRDYEKAQMKSGAKKRK